MTKESDNHSPESLVDRYLVFSVDLPVVLPQVLRMSVEQCGAERGTLIVLDDSGKAKEAAIAIEGRLVQPGVAEIQPILDSGLAGWVLQRQEAVLLSDSSRDARWLRRQDDDQRKTGPKSAMCMPIRNAERVVGILTLVHSSPGFFNPAHLTLLQAIARQAGPAIGNALLFGALQEATRRYQELFDASINPLILTTRTGQILEANRAAAAASGYRVGELVGQPITLLEPAALERLNRGGGEQGFGSPAAYEAEILTCGGGRFPAEIHVAATTICGEVCLQWALRDISERRHLDRLREDLALMIYHDLRTPLSNLVSGIDILDAEVSRDKMGSARPVFAILQRSARRLQHMVDSLLDIQRLEAGQPVANLRPFSCGDLIGDALDAVSPLIESREVTLQLDVDDSLPLLQMDPDMILRVFINLAENGARYAPLGGRLAVGASANEDWVTIWFTDNGSGISAEEQPWIFEKFGRPTSGRAGKGLGLGLAYCRLAVNAHKGKIWVDSSQGQGTRFVVQLPIKAG